MINLCLVLHHPILCYPFLGPSMVSFCLLKNIHNKLNACQKILANPTNIKGKLIPSLPDMMTSIINIKFNDSKSCNCMPFCLVLELGLGLGLGLGLSSVLSCGLWRARDLWLNLAAKCLSLPNLKYFAFYNF